MGMWIITERGEMFSEVKARDSDHRIIRARDRRSIEMLRDHVEDVRGVEGEPVEVVETSDSDYRYRVNLPVEDWQEFVASRIETGTATNVKNAVARELGKEGRKFLDAMMDTWTIWYSYQEDLLRWGK